MEHSKVRLLIKDMVVEERMDGRVTSKLLDPNDTSSLWLYRISVKTMTILTQSRIPIGI